MTIIHHTEFEQNSGEWTARRCGMLTASQMDRILTPTLKIASNEKERQHLFELMAQRITGYVEPQYIGDVMLRGHQDEIHARDVYAEKYAPVTECGFITNDMLGFLVGYSPDGLVGDDGLIEIKSRSQKYQVQTIFDGVMPPEFSLQVQTGLLVSGRKWCDFISYSGGLPMFVSRIWPDDVVRAALVDAAVAFEKRLNERLAVYHTQAAKFHPTERREHGSEIL